jgi:hypothetical protein
MYTLTAIAEYTAEVPGRGIVLCCTIVGDHTIRGGIAIRTITEDTYLSAWADTGPGITAIAVITGMVVILTVGMVTILSLVKSWVTRITTTPITTTTMILL